MGVVNWIGSLGLGIVEVVVLEGFCWSLGMLERSFGF